MLTRRTPTHTTPDEQLTTIAANQSEVLQVIAEFDGRG